MNSFTQNSARILRDLTREVETARQKAEKNLADAQDQINQGLYVEYIGDTYPDQVPEFTLYVNEDLNRRVPDLYRTSTGEYFYDCSGNDPRKTMLECLFQKELNLSDEEVWNNHFYRFSEDLKEFWGEEKFNKVRAEFGDW